MGAVAVSGNLTLDLTDLVAGVKMADIYLEAPGKSPSRLIMRLRLYQLKMQGDFRVYGEQPRNVATPMGAHSPIS